MWFEIVQPVQEKDQYTVSKTTMSLTRAGFLIILRIGFGEILAERKEKEPLSTC